MGVAWDGCLAYLAEITSCRVAKPGSRWWLGAVGKSAEDPAAPRKKAHPQGPRSSGVLGTGDPRRRGRAAAPKCRPAVTGANPADRPPHSGREKQKRAQEGLVARRKYYLTCIVLGKENKGPGAGPGPLASFFFFPLFFSSGQLF